MARLAAIDAPPTSSVPIVGVGEYMIICIKLGKQLYKVLHPEFLFHFWRQHEDSVMMSAYT
jgi:hypothetical protein